MIFLSTEDRIKQKHLSIVWMRSKLFSLAADDVVLDISAKTHINIHPI